MAASSSIPLVQRIISASVAVSNRAGKLIKDIMKRGELGIVDKGVNDLQTEADRSAQKCIVASLLKQFPRVTIIGEEEQDPNEEVDDAWIETSPTDEVLKAVCPENLKSVNDEDVVVWVDPLDGTAEYTQGLLDHVTVLIGVAVKGEAVGGVVHQPYYNYKAGPGAVLGRTVWGIVGLGSYGFNQNKPPEGKRIVTTTRSHSQKTVVDSIEACEPTEVLKVGGAGHKVLLVLEGQAHAYVFASPGCKKWDTCAPEALLHAVGGKLTDIHGNKLQYHKDVKHKNTAGVLATLYADHDWYLNRMPQSVKDNLQP